MMRRYNNIFEFNQYSIIDSDDQKSLMKSARKQLVEEEQDSIVPKPAKLIELFSFARNTTQSITEYLKRYTIYQIEIIEKIIEIMKLYQMKKKVNQYLDFDDILHNFANKIESDPDARMLIKISLCIFWLMKCKIPIRCNGKYYFTYKIPLNFIVSVMMLKASMLFVERILRMFVILPVELKMPKLINWLKITVRRKKF